MHVVDCQGHWFLQFMVYYNSSSTSIHVGPFDPHAYALTLPSQKAWFRIAQHIQRIMNLPKHNTHPRLGCKAMPRTSVS
uniref:Uncharacterized protein n=1 Tax=Romanomermis culicivorax TaxID=13658 RepID=A0A915I1M9_ROMCU